ERDNITQCVFLNTHTHTLSLSLSLSLSQDTHTHTHTHTHAHTHTQIRASSINSPADFSLPLTHIITQTATICQDMLCICSFESVLVLSRPLTTSLQTNTV